MEEILIRFPVVGQKIFKQLDEKNLVQMKKVCKVWHTFLNNDSVFWRRRIQKFAKNQVEFTKDWKLVTENVSINILKELALKIFLPQKKYWLKTNLLITIHHFTLRQVKENSNSTSLYLNEPI